MSARRWSLAGLTVLGLGFLLSASGWSGNPSGILTDAQMESLWGGSPTLYCDMESVEDCHGPNPYCAMFAHGGYEGADCIGPQYITNYFNPEACNSIGQGKDCTNPMNLNVACSKRIRCSTVLINGNPFCDEISVLTKFKTITTDPNQCRNLIINPLLFPNP